MLYCIIDAYVVRQMNWAMTSLLAHKDSPWRGLEVKGSLAEHGCVKLLEIMKSGMAVGKFSEARWSVLAAKRVVSGTFWFDFEGF